MIESIQYTKELPDSDFHKYFVKREDCNGDKFKKSARQFCHYKGYAYLKDGNNWKHLVQQHVQKANLLTKDSLLWPLNKDDVEQNTLFDAQLEKHVIPNEEVAILNAFPMFPIIISRKKSSWRIHPLIRQKQYSVKDEVIRRLLTETPHL